MLVNVQCTYLLCIVNSFYVHVDRFVNNRLQVFLYAVYIFRHLILKDLKAYGGAGYHYRRNGVCVTATKLRGHRYDPTTSKLKCHKNLNNCIIKHYLRNHVVVLKKIMHTPGYFTIHHSNWGEIIFLSMGQKIGLPQFSCISHLVLYILSYFLKLKLQKNISWLRLMYKLYFR